MMKRTSPIPPRFPLDRMRISDYAHLMLDWEMRDEDIACHLGVSLEDLLKWKKDHGLPDIPNHYLVKKTRPKKKTDKKGTRRNAVVGKSEGTVQEVVEAS